MNFKTAIFFSKYSLLKPKAVYKYKEALKNQYLSKDELDALNWSLTKKLLEYAYLKVPFYRNRFNRLGLHPNDIKHRDDYSGVPLLTRDDLQKHFDNIVSKDARSKDLRLLTTGGSTGRPVKVYHQKNVVRAAMGWRMLSWWGLGPGDDIASVYREIQANWKARFINLLIWWPTRKILLNAVHLDKNEISSFVKTYCKIQPKLIHGYVGAIDNLASFILDNDIEVPSPKAIWVTSAPLSEIQRHHITKAFRAPVYDQYGSCETFWISAECKAQEGLHISYDTKTVEFLNDQNEPCKPGQLGKIAVTDLENMYFPLIRYLNGDMGRSINKECSCGIKLPLMDKVKGRTTDIIRLPEGKSIAGDYMTTIFDDFPDAVKQFQVYQHSDYSIEILVIPESDGHATNEILETVRTRLETEISAVVPVSISKTSKIKQTGGKLRFVKSDLK